jgi:hypothetical protein
VTFSFSGCEGDKEWSSLLRDSQFDSIRSASARPPAVELNPRLPLRMDVATRRGWLVLVALVLAIFASTLPPAQGLQPIPSFSDPLSLASAQLIPRLEKRSTKSMEIGIQISTFLKFL